MNALEDYLKVRFNYVEKLVDKNALFVSSQYKRISNKTVQYLVKKYLNQTELGAKGYSVHKLRHTAATLMHQNGVDIRVLKDVLGHENLSTTEIYTHINNAQIREASQKNPLGEFEEKSKKKI